MITDEQMITAILTARQYCKERDCNKCVLRYAHIAIMRNILNPCSGNYRGDDEIIADIGELNDDDE